MYKSNKKLNQKQNLSQYEIKWDVRNLNAWNQEFNNYNLHDFKTINYVIGRVLPKNDCFKI
jgi:hypothetical protein